MPTKLQLIDMVSAKIDEVLPPGEGLLPSDLTEGPVNYMDVEIDEAAKWILRNAPINIIRQMMKKADTHFPSNPQFRTGLIAVGDPFISGGDLSGIADVEYRILSNDFGGTLMPVTATPDPTVGSSRRDIIVGNSQNQLVYLEGDEGVNADLIDFPEIPVNTVLVMKVINIDGAKTYIPGTTTLFADNPNVRLVYDQDTLESIVPLPTDFLRFIAIKLNTWRQPVTYLIDQYSTAYQTQKNNKFTRGTENKPIAALIGFMEYLVSEISPLNPNNNQAIECFTSRETPTLEYLHYIPVVLPENFPQDLVDVMVWESAARCLIKMKQQGAEALRNEVAMFFANKLGTISQ